MPTTLDDFDDSVLGDPITYAQCEQFPGSESPLSLPVYAWPSGSAFLLDPTALQTVLASGTSSPSMDLGDGRLLVTGLPGCPYRFSGSGGLPFSMGIQRMACSFIILGFWSSSEHRSRPGSSTVNKVVAWFQGNHMKVNPDKFQCIVFGKQDNLGSFKIGDHNILPEDNVKILGLHVDNKLNFNTQITQVCQKAGRKVQVLSRLCHVLDQPTNMLLYNSFVECYFNYCSMI